MNFLNKYIRKYRFLFILSVICVTLETFCDLMQPQMMAILIDNGITNSDLYYVLKIGGIMLLITALGACFACSRNILSSKASQRFGAELRRDLFEKIQNLPVSESDKFDGGSLITRLTNDATQLTNFVNGIMRIFFKAPVICFGCIILSSTLNIKTAPIVISIVVIAMVSIILSMKLSFPKFAKTQTAIDKLNTVVREYLLGIRLVKAFGRFKYEKQRFDTVNDELTDTTIKANRIAGFFSPITNLAVNSGIACIILFGSSWVAKGEMKVGEIIAFITYMTQILTSLNIISNILNAFVRTKASYIRIKEVMTIPSAEKEQETATSPEPDFSSWVISFNDVSFTYPGSSGESALQNISLSIMRGETLGVIGATGSGKSTLISLLLRFYEPNSGSIQLGDLNITDINIHTLRHHIAVVPQTATLFTGTIMSNILWGTSEPSEDKMIQSAKAAQLFSFIKSLPAGFNAPVGQGGLNLSGGQKQRLSIARALACNPDVLILDDCTSALDTVTEAAVLKAIRTQSHVLACLLISQRISSIINTDKILVLDNGRVAGFGKHDHLLNNCKIYKEIYVSQTGKEDKNAG